MPQVPHTSQGSASLPASTFVAFREGILAHAAAGTLIPLHLGDTRLLPPAAARALDLEDRALHRYGPVAGFPELRAAVAQDFTRAGLAVDVADVAITPGATGALDVALDMVLDPGEETLVLTPSWPLIFGIASRRGVLRQVPLSPGGELPDPETLAARVAAAITPRTAAIYWSDPNNPVGFCYSDAHRDALYALAEAHGLWVVIDAVYSDLVFSGEPQPLAAYAARRARTFVAVSYSKRFGLAGHRVGALATPPGLGELAARLVTYTTYHASHAGQHMALDVFRDDPDAPRQAWHDLARAGCQAACAALDEAGLAYVRPQGGAFVFLDLRALAPDGDAALALMQRALKEEGVSLAPGAAFGDDYARFARLCFTAVKPSQVTEGIRRLGRCWG